MLYFGAKNMNKSKAGHFTTIKEEVHHENRTIQIISLSDNRDPKHAKSMMLQE